MKALNLSDLFSLNLVQAEVHARNLKTKGDYKPAPEATTEIILQNQQVIMLALSQLLWGNGDQLCNILENRIVHDPVLDRWSFK